MLGAALPRPMPATMQSATQIESHFSKKPIPTARSPAVVCGVVDVGGSMLVVMVLIPELIEGAWQNFAGMSSALRSNMAALGALFGHLLVFPPNGAGRSLWLASGDVYERGMSAFG